MFADDDAATGALPQLWSCSIKIRSKVDARGDKLRNVSVHQFGELITRTEEVELQVRRAQKAVLNPSAWGESQAPKI